MSAGKLDDLSPVKRALLERLTRSEPAKKAPTVPKRTSERAPASAMQRSLWLLHQMHPDSTAYHVVRAWRFRGPLDVPALERALGAVQRRHESLRTALAEADSQLWLQVRDVGPIALIRIDLSSAPNPEATLTERLEELSSQPFDLGQAPLWRAWLLKLGEQEHALLVVFHHILLDLWSMRVFARDLSALYTEYSGGVASRLPELPIQYGDFAAWDAGLPDSQMPQHPSASYWKERLARSSLSLELPADRLHPAVPTGKGRQVRFELNPQISAAVLGLGREEQATTYMTLLSAWSTLLHRYSGRTDMVFGSPSAGRSMKETGDSVGLFIDSMVVPVDLAGDPTFRALLRRVRGEVLGTLDHPIPFQRLVEAIRPERHAGRNPIFQVLFAMQNVPPMQEVWHGLQREQVQVESRTAKFDLSLYVFEEPTGLQGFLEYATDLFDEATVRRWLEHWKTLLAAVCENPDQRISQLPILTAAEQQQILVDWNRTETPFSHDRCFPELFDEQAARTPDAAAVVFEGRTVTYRELRERSDRLAGELRRRGVRRESLVGLCLERSPFLLVALLGIMKSGAAYVPMDPAFPAERLKFLFEDGPIRFLIIEKAVRSGLPRHSAAEILMEEEASWAKASGGTADPPTPGDVVYVLYTSGSTGKPKGVAVTHRSLVNLLECFRRDPGFEKNDRLLALTTAIFDIAAVELYLPLLVGSSVILASRATAVDPTLIAGMLRASRITVMQATPVTWRMLLDSGWVAPQPIRAWIGGEALAQDLAARMLQSIGPVWNLYGPTETTIYSTGGRIENATTRPTIGRPIANTQAYILDRMLQPVPVGIPGDLYIGGAGLARGYWQRPDLTEERFITVPHVAGSSRLYKTGDLARYLPDGRIDYLGRQDFQVKLRGFRIELGDIESHLRQHPKVSDAAVTLREDNPGNPCLVAYLAAAAETAPSPAEIRAFLAKRLPDYMIPSGLVVLDALPLTANGKVDRKALPAPALARPAEPSGGPPRSPLEADLIALWESVLHVRPIGPLDNFFDLGGSSIMAANMFAEMTKLTGKQLPLAMLLQVPTVRQLAEALVQQGTHPARSCLMAVQSAGSLPAFYCVHGGLGKVLVFRNLAFTLGLDQPFHAFESPDISEDELDSRRVEQMAAGYVRDLQAFQPQGPYLLGGLSFGGLIALEMGRLLKQQGERVSLIVFDPSLPAKESLLAHPRLIADRLLHVFRRFRSATWSENKEALLTAARYVRKRRTAVRTDVLPAVKGEPIPKSALLLRKAHQRAADRYRPQPYPGKVRLFQSRGGSTLIRMYNTEAWKKLAQGGVEVEFFSGGHAEFFADDAIPELASILREVLRRCREEQA